MRGNTLQSEPGTGSNRRHYHDQAHVSALNLRRQQYGGQHTGDTAHYIDERELYVRAAQRFAYRLHVKGNRVADYAHGKHGNQKAAGNDFPSVEFFAVCLCHTLIPPLCR